MPAGRGERIILAIAAAALVVAAVVALAWRSEERTLGFYSTSLLERSPSQEQNALLAAEAIDGATIKPGETFSFNETVGSWAADTGFEKAPVSFDGELVLAYGGGVCQTSTTFYNAALLAGMVIVERSPHQWPALYVPLGRDAAVAFGSADLRIRNPMGRPVTIHAGIEGGSLSVSFTGGDAPAGSIRIERTVHDVAQPAEIVRTDPKLPRGVRRTRTAGREGYTVTVQRVFYAGGREARREQVSHDRYRAVSKVIVVGARKP